MPLPSSGFSRTIVLNLNMQLDAETMRRSLEADWELLSPPQKEKMASSSFKSRPAPPRVIEEIKKGSTTCTCGQAAPLDLNPNPLCCSRGTTLAFTWLQNGELQIRLNGNLMDTFNDPDMARAIFYEYFRGDDPISPDFRKHAGEGIPAVLAPLRQFGKNVNIGVKKEEGKGDNKKVRTGGWRGRGG